MKTHPTIKAPRTTTPSETEISDYAYNLYLSGNREHGHDLDHWLKASSSASEIGDTARKSRGEENLNRAAGLVSATNPLEIKTMKNNPLTYGNISENGAGIGIVSRRMIRERAAEIGLINGRSPAEVTKTEWDQAKRELTGDSPVSPLTELLESAPESDRWNPVPGSPGHRALTSGDEGENADGLNEAAQLVEEGVNEAAHDQMLESAREVKRSDELSPP